MAITHIPADWELHTRCWIGMPNQPELWQQRFHAARQTVVDIANAIVDFEPVNLLCPAGYANFLGSYTDSRIEIIEAHFDAGWLRDIAPMYIKTQRGSLRALFSDSNRYLPSYRLAKQLLARGINLPTRTIPVALENGAITVDGEGTLLCTKTSVFGVSKNIDKEEEHLESRFEKILGARQTHWLKRGLATDPTRGNIVNLARFITPTVILLASHSNRQDPNRTITMDSYHALTAKDLRDAKGRKLHIYQVHNPPPIQYRGSALCNSYTNFYIANDAVIIPGFYKPKYDRQALELFRVLFPRHHIIQIQVLPLLTGGGGIHCVTCPQFMSVREQRLVEKLQNERIKQIPATAS